jgi:hypothetical protein
VANGKENRACGANAGAGQARGGRDQRRPLLFPDVQQDSVLSQRDLCPLALASLRLWQALILGLMDGANGLGSLNAGSMGGGMPDAFDANLAFGDPLASQQNTAVGGFGGHQGGSFMPFDPQPHGAGPLQGAHHPGHAGANGHGHPLDPPASMSGGRPTPSLHTMGAPGVPRPILSPTSFSDSSRVPTPLQPFPPNSATSGTMPFTNGFPMPGPSDGMGFAFSGAHGGMPPQHPMGGPSGAMGQMLPSPNGPMGMVPPQMHGMPGMLSHDAQMQQQMMMMAMMPAFPMGMAGMSVPPGMLPPGQFNIRPEDEREFARALHHGDKTNRTLRQVIDDFAQVRRALYAVPLTSMLTWVAQKRNQPPVLWKDFYLENIKRLQELSLKGDDDADTQTPAGTSGAATAPPGRGKSVKKPYFDPPSSPEDSPRGRKRVPARRFASDEDRKPSPAELRAASAKSRSTNPLKRKASAGSTGPGTSGRRPPTTSSRIGFAPTTKRLPLLQSNVLIPPVRSRSPTPPTEIVPQPGRVGVNMYTDADRAYFVDFIQFELTREPELSKHELCERLHIRAPHHSVESWKSHWSSRHAVADNILRLAAERVEARERAAGRRPPEPESDSDPPSRQSPAYVPRAAPPEPPPPKVKYETPSASEGEDAGVRTDSTTRSEDVMGGRDSQLTEADQRAMARYIATWTPGGWKATKNRTRWLPFGEKVWRISPGARSERY